MTEMTTRDKLDLLYRIYPDNKIRMSIVEADNLFVIEQSHLGSKELGGYAIWRLYDKKNMRGYGATTIDDFMKILKELSIDNTKLDKLLDEYIDSSVLFYNKNLDLIKAKLPANYAEEAQKRRDHNYEEMIRTFFGMYNPTEKQKPHLRVVKEEEND